MDSNGGKFKTSRNDNKNKRDYEVKRAEVRIGLALTALFSLVSAGLTGWSIALYKEEMGYKIAQLIYTITIQCEPDNPDHLVESLVVENVGDGTAKNVNIVLHDTVSEILVSEILGKPESLPPHENCKPSVYMPTMTTIAVTVPSLHADGGTYRMRIPLTNYGSTDASRALQIALLQLENAEVTTESPTRERAHGRIAEPIGFPGLKTHVVKPGDQLSDIAAQYSLSVESLAMFNQDNPDFSEVGSLKPEGILIIQPATCGETTITEERILGHHIWRPRETIYCIARAYGVDPWAIATVNGLVFSSQAHPGFRLAIPAAWAMLPDGPTCDRQFSPPPPPAYTCRWYHTATAWDNLYRISLRYEVSMWEIAEANGIRNLTYIRAGDVLCIP